MQRTLGLLQTLSGANAISGAEVVAEVCFTSSVSANRLFYPTLMRLKFLSETVAKFGEIEARVEPDLGT